MSNGASNGVKDIDSAKKDDVNNAAQDIISDCNTGGGLGSVIQGVQNGVGITATQGGGLSSDEQNEGNGNNNNFGDPEVNNETFGVNEINCGRFEDNNIF